MNRRRFIQRGLLGGAVLALGSATGLIFYPGREGAAPAAPLFALSPRAFQVLVAIAARVIPAGGDARAVAARVDAALQYAAAESRRDVVRALHLFDNALVGWLLAGHPMPFTRAPPEAQDAILEGWRRSHLVLCRSAYQAVRRLSLSAYYADRATWAAIGYPGPRPTAGLFYPDSKWGT